MWADNLSNTSNNTSLPTAIPEGKIITRIDAAMEDLTLSQMAAFSDYAIVGRVLKVTPIVIVDDELAKSKKENTNPQLMILDSLVYSDVKIRVTEDLWDVYDKKVITVRVPGGETTTMITYHNYSPELQRGEEVVIFVGSGVTDEIGNDKYTIKGLSQGTFRIANTGVNPNASVQAFDALSNVESIQDQIRSLK